MQLARHEVIRPVHKNQFHICTSNKQYENEIKKKIPLTITSKEYNT